MTSRKKFIKTIYKVSIWPLFCAFPSEFESLFRVSTLLYTSRLSLSFQLAFEGVSLIFRCDDPTYNNPSHGRLFKLQASRQSRKTRASVLLALLLALGCKCTSLSAGIHTWVQAVQYLFFLLGSFFLISACLCSFPYFLSLPVLGLGSKSFSLSPEFCVQRPSKYDKICWELNPIFGFFAFSG